MQKIEETTEAFVGEYIRNVPAQYHHGPEIITVKPHKINEMTIRGKQFIIKVDDGVAPRKPKGRSIRIDEHVYDQIIKIKMGNATISDVIEQLLLQPGIKASSTMNDVAVQPQAQVVPITLSDMISGK
jgi:hypothetical protein